MVPVGESAGLRRITYYHARHSALSYLRNSGQVPIAVVAAWAEHADGGATALKHYIRFRSVTSKPPGTPSPRERARSDVRHYEKSAANNRPSEAQASQ